MRVTLCCHSDRVTIRFAPTTAAGREYPVVDLPGAWLVVDEVGRLCGLRVTGLDALCPYELRKVIRANAGGEIQAELHSTYDSSCDMGYINLDRRGPASVAYTVGSIDQGVCIDIGKDGVILGLELFSTSQLLPTLAGP